MILKHKLHWAFEKLLRLILPLAMLIGAWALLALPWGQS